MSLCEFTKHRAEILCPKLSLTRLRFEATEPSSPLFSTPSHFLHHRLPHQPSPPPKTTSTAALRTTQTEHPQSVSLDFPNPLDRPNNRDRSTLSPSLHASFPLSILPLMASVQHMSLRSAGPIQLGCLFGWSKIRVKF